MYVYVCSIYPLREISISELTRLAFSCRRLTMVFRVEQRLGLGLGLGRVLIASHASHRSLWSFSQDSQREGGGGNALWQEAAY